MAVSSDMISKFASMDEEEKFQLMAGIMDLCPPVKRLHLQERLKTIWLDILTLLPPEIAVHIFSYLSVKDLISAWQVCKSWQYLTAAATPLWRKVARKIGLSDFVMESNLPKYGSASAIVLTAIRHRRFISSLRVERRTNTLQQFAAEGWYTLNCTPDLKKLTFHRPISDERKELCFETCSSDSSVASHKASVRDDDDLAVIGLYDMLYLQRKRVLLWPRYIGIDDSDGDFDDSDRVKWVGWDLEEGTVASMWEYDRSTTEADRCGTCGVGVSMASYPPAGRFWELFTRILIPGTANTVTTSQLQVPTCVLSKESDVHLQMRLLPSLYEQSYQKESVCDSHRLLITVYGQADWEAQFLIAFNVPATGAVVCPPLQVMQTDGGIDIIERVSADGCLCCVKTWCYPDHVSHHIWELDSGRHFQPQIPRYFSVIALGHIYSIATSPRGENQDLDIFVTMTGERLMNFATDSVEVYATPAMDKWLNDFDFEDRFEVAGNMDQDNGQVFDVMQYVAFK